MRSEIDKLRDWGVVDESAERATIRAALQSVVVKTINSPIAPFRIRLNRGAVPVPDPEPVE